MHKLSVVLISFNNAEGLKKCLASASFANEIIVVDSGSTDNAREVALEMGAKLYRRTFDGYGSQKNYAISCAENEWILSLDNDEVISDKLKKEIIKTLKNPGSYDGFMIPYLNFFLDKPLRCEDERYTQLRLFKKSSGGFLLSPVHERVEIQGNIGSLRHCIHHYSYRSIDQILTKFDFYTEKEVEIRRKQGRIFKPRQLLYYPLAIFWRRFAVKKGYKDGLHGLVLTMLFMIYQFEIYLKLWAEQRKKRIKDKG